MDTVNMYPVNMYPWVETSTNFSNFPRWGGYCHIYLKLLKFSQVGWILPHLPQTSQIFPGGFTGQIKFNFPLLASKPRNWLSSVKPFYKWEAMSFHHILLDLVSDFGKGPKSFFLILFFKTLFKTYFLNLPNLHSPLWRALASKLLNWLWRSHHFRNGKPWSFTTYFRIWSLIF